MHIYIYSYRAFVHTYMYVHIDIYTYREREREIDIHIYVYTHTHLYLKSAVDSALGAQGRRVGLLGPRAEGWSRGLRCRQLLRLLEASY